MSDDVTALDELDVPFVSIDPSNTAGRSTRRQLADEGHWLVQTELGYLVVGYDDVQAVLRDRRWHSGLGMLTRRPDDPAFNQWRAERQPTILHLEGPDHDRLRQTLTPALTPRSVDRRRPRMREVFDQLLDEVLDGPAAATAQSGDGDGGPAGSCEFVATVCEPYPVRVVFELLGAPSEMVDDFIRMSRSAGAARREPSVAAEVVMADTEAFDRFAAELIERTDTGGDGLLVDLIAANRQGRISRPELVSLTQTMLVAGTESTSGQLACAAVLLARFDDQYRLLRERPELVTTAVEEVMRYLGTARGTVRLASEELDYRGVRFPAGTMILLGFTAANRDRSRFVEPDTFDVTRAFDTPHLTLGHGIHYCVGASLARAELQEALTALVDRVARIELAGEIEWRPQTADFWGPAALPVILHPDR
ncbi:MAG: cytochrome P450 [Acidimicrobiales bacterium]